jgi:hypothetical protein
MAKTITGINNSHYQQGEIQSGKTTVDVFSKLLDFLRKQNEEELSRQYRRAISFVDICREALEIEWNDEKLRKKWLDQIEATYTEVYNLQQIIKEKCIDRLDFSDGGSYSGVNPLNEVQNECVAIETEQWQYHVKEFIIENQGTRELPGPTGTDPDPEIPFCHFKSSVYKPRWYLRTELDKKGRRTLNGPKHFRMNIRVLVDNTGEPKGVPKNWEPEQVYETFEKDLKEIKIINGHQVEVKAERTINIPINVPDVFAICKELSTGYISATIMQSMSIVEKELEIAIDNLWSKTCFIGPLTLVQEEELSCAEVCFNETCRRRDANQYHSTKIEGKLFYHRETITAIDRDAMSIKLKDADKIPSIWKDPKEWNHKTMVINPRKRITYLKEGGIPFFGSKQLYVEVDDEGNHDGYQYENSDPRRLVFTINDPWYKGIHDAFLQALDIGNVSTCKARDKNGTKLQAYKIMRCPVKRGGTKVMKNIVLFTDLKW